MPANAYSLLVAPLANTTTNNAEQLLTCLQTGDQVLVFNGSGYNFDVYIGPGNWIDGGTGNPINAPLLPPGQGFFYQTGAGVQETNTATGVVVLTNSIALPLNSYNLVGSTAPIAGSVESTNFSLPLQTGDQVLIYNGSGYNFDVYISPGTWIDGGTGNPIAVPTVTVGQGFFYQTGAGVTEQWNQNVVVQ